MTQRETALTEGARLVAVAAFQIGAAELARRIGTSEGMVRHLARGRRTPSPWLVAKLHELGVADPSAWSSEPSGPLPLTRLERMAAARFGLGGGTR